MVDLKEEMKKHRESKKAQEKQVDWKTCTQEQKDRMKEMWQLQAERDNQIAEINEETGEVILKKKPDITQEQQQEARILLGKTYEMIKEFIKFYVDIPEKYISLISIWVLGTYFYKNFETYPYLFFNAMKGSGKTRMLKLITSIADDGKLLASLTESVMFRSTGTLGIDEFENLGSKEKQALRELLNASYKKGIKIQRMKKVKSFTGEEQRIEEFEPYKPIVMANIWGIEEILADRCITLILEKSPKLEHIKLIEDFAEHPTVLAIKANVKVVKCMLCSVGSVKNIIKEWNLYVKSHYTTQDTLNTLPTQYTLPTQQRGQINENENLFLKIDTSELDGRNLELFFSLFLMAKELNEEILNEIIEIAREITKGKRTEEMVESKDVTLIDFISRQTPKEWYILKQLTTMFRQFTHDEEGENAWINPTWVGRALRRLSLVIEKRRIGEGIQVILNIEKAKEKMKIFEK
jgi:hypothetical protein